MRTRSEMTRDTVSRHAPIELASSCWVGRLWTEIPSGTSFPDAARLRTAAITRSGTSVSANPEARFLVRSRRSIVWFNIVSARAGLRDLPIVGQGPLGAAQGVGQEVPRLIGLEGDLAPRLRTTNCPDFPAQDHENMRGRGALRGDHLTPAQVSNGRCRGQRGARRRRQSGERGDSFDSAEFGGDRGRSAKPETEVNGCCDGHGDLLRVLTRASNSDANAFRIRNLPMDLKESGPFSPRYRLESQRTHSLWQIQDATVVVWSPH